MRIDAITLSGLSNVPIVLMAGCRDQNQAVSIRIPQVGVSLICSDVVLIHSAVVPAASRLSTSLPPNLFRHQLIVKKPRLHSCIAPNLQIQEIIRFADLSFLFPECPHLSLLLLPALLTMRCKS